MAAGWGSVIAAVAMVAMVGGMVAVLTSPSPLAATSQLLSTSEQESSRKLVGGDRRTVGWVKVEPPKIHISPLHADESIDDGSLDSLYREVWLVELALPGIYFLLITCHPPFPVGERAAIGPEGKTSGESGEGGTTAG